MDQIRHDVRGWIHRETLHPSKGGEHFFLKASSVQLSCVSLCKIQLWKLE